jgi:hypothetical protein
MTEDVKHRMEGREMEFGRFMAEVMEKLTVVQTEMGVLSDRQRESDASNHDMAQQIEELTEKDRVFKKESRRKAENTSESTKESHYSSLVSSESEELFGQYTAIKDSVQKIVLPGTMTVADSGVTAKGEAKRVISTLKMSANFVTTSLKVIKTIVDKNEVDMDDLDVLFTIQQAHLRRIQSEHTAAIVEGTGVPKETVQMFKFFSKNSSCFTTQESQALENAARVSAAAAMAKNADTPTRGRGGRRFNSYRGGYNARNTFNKDSKDAFEAVVSQAGAGKP